MQFVESLVLDASEIVYINALLKPDGEGPFNYREDEGYNKDFLKGDTIFLAFRASVTFISALLYCPDYFEYFLSEFDEKFFLRTTNPDYLLTRDTISIVSELILASSIVSQTIISYFTLNPILLGLHLGETVGQAVFVVTRSLYYSTSYLSYGSDTSIIR